jgi:DNA-directed RNA polymerase subunit M/transcription elongation factor TFIIS
MSLFNEKQIHGMMTGEYPCPECGTLMIWEDEDESILVCEACGYSVDSDRYGFTDEEYEALYLTPEQFFGEDNDKDDEDDCDGEYYEEVFDEISHRLEE